MKMAVINGPNLNLLGTREVEIYGKASLLDLEHLLLQRFPNIEFTFFQSNLEGELINEIQRCGKFQIPLIINPGGYSHTSVAIHDALLNHNNGKIEVHLSNIHRRETFRHQSITAQACNGIIAGLGLTGYLLAVEALLGLLSKGPERTV